MAFTPGKSRKVSGVIGAVLVALVVLALTAGAFVTMAGSASDSFNAQLKTDPSKSATPSPKPSPKHASVCKSSWKMETFSYENNKLVSEGVASIRNAKTPSDAAKAAFDLSERVRKDPAILKAFISTFLHKDVEVGTLTDSKGCASETATQLTIELDLAFANAKSIVPDQAPSNGYNSGVDNGIVVGETVSGIRGDRTAIKIVLSDGTTAWVMGRCANIVTAGPPPFPPGKTDNPPCTDKCTPPIIHVCLPPTPHGTWPLCKDDSIVAPQPGTTAPTAGGNSVNPGSGAPTQIVVLPAAPYAPPPPPPATPQPQPTLDPAPAPSVEPSAAPTPVTQCISAPGDTPC